MIEIEFVPTDKPGNYWPMVNGRKLRRATRQPFLDGARALLEEGISPETETVGRHRASATIALQSTVREAAKWSITERDRGGLKRIPYASYNHVSCDTSEAPAAEEGSAGASEPEDAPRPFLGPRTHPTP